MGDFSNKQSEKQGKALAHKLPKGPDAEGAHPFLDARPGSETRREPQGVADRYASRRGWPVQKKDGDTGSIRSLRSRQAVQRKQLGVIQRKDGAYPTNPNLEKQSNLKYGLSVKLTWDSSSGDLEDLDDVKGSENITFSDMPNPPFSKPDGNDDPDAGTTQRLEDMDGHEDGETTDDHEHPPNWLRKLSSIQAGTYTVDQTNDYKRPEDDDWVTFATYVIEYKVYDKDPPNEDWYFKVSKTGDHSVTPSDQALDEAGEN